MFDEAVFGVPRFNLFEGIADGYLAPDSETFRSEIEGLVQVGCWQHAIDRFEQNIGKQQAKQCGPQTVLRSKCSA